MKKRSLFAAVAMLIVSAIVLTSATYAWFATGGTTSINTITGKVAEASAGIRLRTVPTSGAAATGWVNSLDYVKLAKDTTNNHFATNYTSTGDMTTSGFQFLDPSDANALVVTDSSGNELTYEPVSTLDPRAHVAATPTIFAYQLAANGQFANIESGKDLNSFYDCYSFYVATLTEDEDASTNDTNINMTVKIGGSAASAARVAVYSYDGSTWTDHGIFSGAAESNWKPLVAALDFSGTPANTYTDANNNFILDANDTSTDANMADKISSTAVSTTPAATPQTILLENCHVQDSASGNRLVKVYVWLEGNDTDCAPTNARVPGGNITVEYGFSMAS